MKKPLTLAFLTMFTLSPMGYASDKKNQTDLMREEIKEHIELQRDIKKRQGLPTNEEDKALQEFEKPSLVVSGRFRCKLTDPYGLSTSLIIDTKKGAYEVFAIKTDECPLSKLKNIKPGDPLEAICGASPSDKNKKNEYGFYEGFTDTCSIKKISEKELLKRQSKYK